MASVNVMSNLKLILFGKLVDICDLLVVSHVSYQEMIVSLWLSCKLSSSAPYVDNLC